MAGERPGRVFVIEPDRVVDPRVLHGPADVPASCSKENPGVCASMTAVFAGPGAQVGKLAEPARAGVGPEADQDHLPRGASGASGGELSHPVARRNQAACSRRQRGRGGVQPRSHGPVRLHDDTLGTLAARGPETPDVTRGVLPGQGPEPLIQRLPGTSQGTPWSAGPSARLGMITSAPIRSQSTPRHSKKGTVMSIRARYSPQRRRGCDRRRRRSGDNVRERGDPGMRPERRCLRPDLRREIRDTGQPRLHRERVPRAAVRWRSDDPAAHQRL